MDPITVVVSAIALGASAALKGTVEQAIKDGYAGLKALLVRKFGAKGGAEAAIAGVEKNPGSKAREAVLREELESAGVQNDQEIVDASTELLKRLETAEPGTTNGLVGQINAAGGKVAVIGTNYGPINM